MDIEEYLRQKRELEAKKSMLEAKEKVVDHDKERFKKEQRAKIYAEHGVTAKHAASEHDSSEHLPPHHYKMPSSGPGMWNTLLLFLILVLLVVSYFIPRFGEDQIRSIVKVETGKNTIDTQENQKEETVDPDDDDKDGVPNDDDECLTTPSACDVDATGCSIDSDEDGTCDALDKKEPVSDGPLFSILAKDDEEGLFDDEGKLDGEILVVNIEKGLKYYEDFTIEISNKESESIVCKIDRDIQIDTDFDGKIDLKDADLDRFKLEIDPKSSESISSDVAPGTVETGTYEGKGDLRITYDARCKFCLDRDCNKVDDTAESNKRTFFRVWINRELEGNNTTNNTKK